MAMKSETPDEARKRLEALSEAEKKGAAAASEGQLQPIRDATVPEDSVVIPRIAEPQPAQATTQDTSDAAGKRKARKR